MSEAKVDLTVQDGGAVSAWQRYQAALEAVLNVDRQRTAEDKKAAQAAAELGRIKARVLGEIETKEEKLKNRMADINRLRDAGRLTEEQYGRAIARTRQQLVEATQQQQVATGAAHQHMQVAALGAAKFAGAVLGVGSAIGAVSVAANLLKREWENLKEAQKTAADRQMDAAAAQREALQNIGDDPELAGGKATEMVKEMSLATGASQADLWRTFSGAASFRGDLSNKRAMDSVRAAAMLDPRNADAMQKNTIAAMALMKEDPNVTPDQALGFIIGAKVASPVIQNAAFAEHVVPNIVSAQKWGGTAREGAALHSAIANSISDIEGRVSATAATQLGKQLAEVLPKVEGGTLARLEALQLPENEKIKRRMLGVFGENFKKAKGDAGGEVTSEAKAFTTILQLIEGKGRAPDLVKDALGKVPEIGAAAPILGKTIDLLNAEPLQQNMMLKNALGAGAEGLSLGNIVGARGAISREGLTEVLKASGMGKFSQDIALAEFELSTKGGSEAAPENVIKQLRRRAGDLQTTKKRLYQNLPGGVEGDYAAPIYETVPNTNPDDLSAARDLNRIAESLQVIVDLTKAQNKEVADQGKVIKDRPVARPNTLPPGRRAAEGVATKP